MKVKKIISQNRRDFWADYECEHCGSVEENKRGYDDEYFHKNVIPSWECKKCGKKADDSYRPLSTKYPSNFQV